MQDSNLLGLQATQQAELEALVNSLSQGVEEAVQANFSLQKQKAQLEWDKGCCQAILQSRMDEVRKITGTLHYKQAVQVEASTICVLATSKQALKHVCIISQCQPWAVCIAVSMTAWVLAIP